MSSRTLARRVTALALAAPVAVAVVAGVPAGCSQERPRIVKGPVDVGSPCTPPHESDPTFGGFDITQESIVTGTQGDICISGICLVNHFQGRVSCPLGQPAPTPCLGIGDQVTCGGGTCTEVELPDMQCDPDDPSPCGDTGMFCDPTERRCFCNASAPCGPGTFCGGLGQCVVFVCRTSECQETGRPADRNKGKSCCVPDTDIPVAVPVCGACDAASHRNADDAVYCSCRCAPAEGAPPEPGAKFCACPRGFACTEIRRYFGLGDPGVAGSYCVKEGTRYEDNPLCGTVQGFDDPATCQGVQKSP